LTALARLLRLFAASVLPGGGFLFAGWSPATALALYWVDNIVSAVSMSVRIALHRRLTGVSGHNRAQLGATMYVSVNRQEVASGFKSFLAEFLLTTIGFNVAHGIFLAAVLAILAERPDPSALRQGAIGILICHGLALSFDAVRIDQWPFARLKYQATQVMGRVIVVHMAILGGMALFAWRGTPGAFFSVFVWLKLLADIGTMLPQWNPREPPRWLVSVMNLFPKQKGETFEAYWRRTRATEDAQAVEDEQVKPPPQDPRRPRRRLRK
jgi:Family of unknown function (DUF6498)